MSFLVLALAVFLLPSVARADAGILTFYDSGKQQNIYFIQESENETFVFPTPSKPDFSKVDIKIENYYIDLEYNSYDNKDIRALTSIEFKSWLAGRNEAASKYNIENIETLYAQNWYFVVVVEKPANDKTISVVSQAATIDSTINTSNFSSKLADVIIDIYTKKDYQMYLKWKPVFSLINTELNIFAYYHTPFLIDIESTNQTEFNDYITSVKLWLSLAENPTAQNITDAKQEIQYCLILSQGQSSSAYLFKQFYFSGLGNTETLSDQELVKQLLNAMYDAAKINDFIAFKKIYRPVMIVTSNNYVNDINDSGLRKYFDRFRNNLSTLTKEQYYQNNHSNLENAIAQGLSADFFSSQEDDDDRGFFIRIDFNTDRMVYNYQADASIIIASKNIYSGRNSEFDTSDLADMSVSITNFPIINLEDKSWKFTEVDYSEKKIPYFPQILTEQEIKQMLEKARITARDKQRISDIKQIQTALELYYNDAGRYPESIKVGTPIAYEGSTYLTNIPVNPAPGGKAYEYRVCGNGENYQLSYTLEGQTSSISAGKHIATGGSIIDDGETKCAPKDYKSENNSAEKDCTDQDDGDIYRQGTVAEEHDSTSAIYFDTCMDKYNVKEYVCQGNTATYKIIGCDNGCSSGACVKIPVGVEERALGQDTDSDGLDDRTEDALGTDSEDADSDSDGYLDGVEVKNGFNPLGSGGLKIDNGFAGKQEGKILLQVEGRGEAWYIKGGKRYYMANGDSAYKIMRYLSVGITNTDLNKISPGEF